MDGRARSLLIVIVGAFVAAGCSSPTGPTPNLSIACPVSETVQSPDGQPLAVTFTTPITSGGTPPLTVTCTPASGSLFPVGGTAVTCVVTDSQRQANSCAFTVTVQTPPTLALTRFVAFGDSITEGKLADGTVLSTGGYPMDLQTELWARYPAQASAIRVFNEGCAGETAQAPGGICPSGGGVVRLPTTLAADNAQAVLLLEGANDLYSSDGNLSYISPLINALRTMVDEAKSRGVVVFLATLTPTRQGGTPEPRGDGGFIDTPIANDQIRALAASEGVFLVDLYQGFNGSPDPYIDTDGLHPNVQGYQKIADLFFAAIQSRLEGTPASVRVVRQPQGYSLRNALFLAAH